MGTADRRERERLALRAKIMDSARQLFVERGRDAVTIRSIAEAIEYSPRTIYLHFKDKEDLLRQLCAEDFQAFGANLAQHLHVADPIERITLLGQAYAAFAFTHPHHYIHMFMNPPAVAPDEDMLANAGDPEADAYALLRGSVQEAMDKDLFKPEFQDVELITQILWAGSHGVVSLHLTRTGEGYVPWRPIEERVATMGRAVLTGLLKQPPAAPAEPKKPQATKRKKA
jgi:AcrR family transcriptional regulator